MMILKVIFFMYDTFHKSINPHTTIYMKLFFMITVQSKYHMKENFTLNEYDHKKRNYLCLSINIECINNYICSNT